MLFNNKSRDILFALLIEYFDKIDISHIVLEWEQGISSNCPPRQKSGPTSRQLDLKEEEREEEQEFTTANPAEFP